MNFLLTAFIIFYRQIKQNKMKSKIISLFFLMAVSLLTVKSSFAVTLQIYPSNLSDSTNLTPVYYGMNPTSCDGWITTCYQNPSPLSGAVLVPEGSEAQTFKQTGGAWWTSYAPPACTGSCATGMGGSWNLPFDETWNCSGGCQGQSIWAQQAIKIPSNILVLQRVKFYSIIAGGDNALKLQLCADANCSSELNNITLAASASRSSADFNNLTWRVSPQTIYYLRLSTTSNLSVPLISSCRTSNCAYGIHVSASPPDRWQNSDFAQNPHQTYNPYPDVGSGGAAAGFSNTYNNTNWFSGLVPANIARMAVWGATVPPTIPSLSAQPACIPSGGDTGADITISWTNQSYPVTVVDVSTTSGFSSFNNKLVTGTSTSGSGFNGGFTWQSSTTYYIRTWDGHDHSPTLTMSGITTCTSAPASVKLGSLTIGSALTPLISGAAKTSGRTQEEDSSTAKGSNWYNPMNISLTATGGIGLTTQYYVAFYDKTSGQITISSTFLPTLQARIKTNPAVGFLLRYDAGSQKYYVWDWSAAGGTGCTTNGCFVDITTFGTRGYPIYNSARGVLYWAYPKQSSQTIASSWRVKIMAAFGSKSMYTPGYVVNIGSSPLNSDFNSDMQPVVVPVTASLPVSSSLAVIPAIKQLISFYFQQLLALL